MGLFYGLGYSKLERSTTYTALGHAAAALRMAPSLVLAIISRNARVLEAALTYMLVPMILAFWVARGVEALGRLVQLTLREHGVREEELQTLRQQVEQIEKARRAELEESHLRRLRESDASVPPALALPGGCTDVGPVPGPPMVGQGSASRCSRRRRRPSDDSEDTEHMVHGGSLFAGMKHGDYASVAARFQ